MSFLPQLKLSAPKTNKKASILPTQQIRDIMACIHHQTHSLWIWSDSPWPNN